MPGRWRTTSGRCARGACRWWRASGGSWGGASAGGRCSDQKKRRRRLTETDGLEINHSLSLILYTYITYIYILSRIHTYIHIYIYYIIIYIIYYIIIYIYYFNDTVELLRTSRRLLMRSVPIEWPPTAGFLRPAHATPCPAAFLGVTRRCLALILRILACFSWSWGLHASSKSRRHEIAIAERG